LPSAALDTQVAKKLIEVALPLKAINKASVQESYIYRGNPSAIHKWWAQRPLAAARAVIFAQMVDDPSAHPDLFRSRKAQEKERERLFRIIEDLVQWDNMSNETVLRAARQEIWQSWRRACAENADHPQAKALFDRNKLPPFQDPFAGGGTLPLEAQRLGLDSYGSDLNPVAVLINKALIEIPPKFASKPPVNHDAQRQKEQMQKVWRGAEGLAEDVRYYGRWMHEEAAKRIGHLYPDIEITTQTVTERPDLAPLLGQRVKVIAWIWARTVKSPNPAFASVDVPLVSTFKLSTKSGKEACVEPVVEGSSYRFTVKIGKSQEAEPSRNGTKLSRANFRCLMSGVPILGPYVKAEAMAGRMGTRLMAIVAESERGRFYLAPTPDHEAVARRAIPGWKPDVEFFQQALGFRVGNYGMSKWSDLFTLRQLVALTTFSDLVTEARELVHRDALAAHQLGEGGASGDAAISAAGYADALTLYLAFAISKATDYNCALVPWYTKEDRPGHLFSQQAIPMVWDFAELNILDKIGGGFPASIRIVADALAGCPATETSGNVSQCDAVAIPPGAPAVISTDPPYYDNIGYADLSDFFYVWLRRALKPVFPELFGTLAVPKAEELVATPGRHGGGQKAKVFFLNGMTQAMHRLSEQTHPAFPVTIYYAFQQSETESEQGSVSTGWETFLSAVIAAGFSIGGTWPMRTERTSRSRGIRSNALASSIVLVCRPRAADARSATRREFVEALKFEMPTALEYLKRGHIAPVDLEQAVIGPGMAIFTRYSQVLDAEGNPLSVGDAYSLIIATKDEVLAESEGDLDADTRWAVTWFDQFGFLAGDYGMAEQLSKSKNTSLDGMVQAGILVSKANKVRLLKPSELRSGWEPSKDAQFTVWEIVHQLIRTLESSGEPGAATLLAKLGSKAEPARELAYRLFNLCTSRKRAAEAMSYNSLGQSWAEIARLARETAKPAAPAQKSFGNDVE
jgi:putative DNA methylase